jgi:hypothetical protein
VVRLLDGTYVPHMPTRVRGRARPRRGAGSARRPTARCTCWRAGVFAPNEEEMTWVLQGPGGQPVRLAGVGAAGGPGALLVQPGGRHHPGQPDGPGHRLPAARADRKHGMRALCSTTIGQPALPRACGSLPSTRWSSWATALGPFYKTPDEVQGAGLAAGVLAARGGGTTVAGARRASRLVRDGTAAILG